MAVGILEPREDLAGRVVENRACPGILMFNAGRKLLWADRRAWELCKAIPRTPGKSKAVPAEVRDICREVAANAKHKKLTELHSPLVRKIIHSKERLLVCGFALPEPDNSSAAKILIVIERIGRRQDAAAVLAKEVYRLTQREVQVVQQLMKGWSNKEIAHELKVTEQTVKEHLQRIMTKTQTLSRTGIVARVFLL
jgi:DNA-binding CsgD family transcriptional regulator